MPIRPGAFVPRRTAEPAAGGAGALGPWLILLPFLVLAAACSGPSPSPSQVAVGGLAGPPAGPALVRVHDFAVSPGEVRLDPSLGERFPDLPLDGEGRTPEELDAGHRLADALAEALVREVEALGVPAERAAGPMAGEGGVLVVKGVILSRREGDQGGTEVVGLATDRTGTRAEMLVHDAGPAWMREPEALGLAEAGLLEPIPAAGPGGGAGTGARPLTDAADEHEEAGPMARELAQRLAATFARMGWLPSRS